MSRQVAVVLLTFSLLSCPVGSGQSAAQLPDPVRILTSAPLSHGIGSNPFDSPLIRDPTNAALLVEARNGVEIASLSKLIPNRGALAKRLDLLEKNHLILRRSDWIRTSFPIVMGKQREDYNRLVHASAEQLRKELRPAIAALLRELKRRGWDEWAYHFVWSQLFDSQFAWSEMVELHLAPPLAPAIGWVVYPAHPYMTGTNYYPDDQLGDQLLAVSWAPGAANTTGLIGGNWRIVLPSALANKAPDPEGAKKLRELGLLRKDRTIAVPVVHRMDRLYVRLQKTSHTYVSLLTTKLPLKRCAALLDVSEQLAWAMAYHDTSWELIRMMIEDGEFKRPISLAPTKGAVEAPSLVGTCAIVDTYEPFVKMLEKVLQTSE